MRFVRAFLIFARRFGPKPPVEWTIADAKGLQAFLGSHTGSKFRRLLENEISAANERAALSRGSAFESGWACGFKGIHAWFIMLSAQMEESPTSEDEEVNALDPALHPRQWQ